MVLQPAAFQILLALAAGDAHGYAIMRDAGLGPATLYSSIKRLLDAGLIEEAEPAPGADTRRRTYRLTRAGRDAAASEAAHLAELVETARARRLLPQPGAS